MAAGGWWGFGLHWAWVPLIGFLTGAGMLIALLVIWLAQGHPQYRLNEPTIVYISDVGADNQTLFIVLGSITAVLFFASLWLDFSLRHTYRIPVRLRWTERLFSALAIFAGFVCALCCILLTCFNAFTHSTAHWTCAVIFFVALLVSGLFNMLEIACLHRDYRQDKLIKASFAIKLLIEIVGIGGLIALGAASAACNNPPGANARLSSCDASDSAAAVLEWLITACFGLYILSMVLDLYPSAYTSGTARTKRMEMQGAALNTQEPTYPPGGHAGADVMPVHQKGVQLAEGTGPPMGAMPGAPAREQPGAVI